MHSPFAYIVLATSWAHGCAFVLRIGMQAHVPVPDQGDIEKLVLARKKKVPYYSHRLGVHCRTAPSRHLHTTQSHVSEILRACGAPWALL